MMPHQPAWLSQCDAIGRRYKLRPEDVTVESNPFALRFCRDPRQRNRLIKKMRKVYANYGAEAHSDDPMRWCAVHTGETWWRGEVLSCSRDEDGFVTSVEILYVDRGWSETVPITHVYPLEDAFLDVPPLSIRVTVDCLEVDNVDKVRDLLETHPKAKIRIRLMEPSNTGRLYATALRAYVKIGYEEWINFAELCSRLNIGTMKDSGKGSSEMETSDTGRSAVDITTSSETSCDDPDVVQCSSSKRNQRMSDKRDVIIASGESNEHRLREVPRISRATLTSAVAGKVSIPSSGDQVAPSNSPPLNASITEGSNIDTIVADKDSQNGFSHSKTKRGSTMNAVIATRPGSATQFASRLRPVVSDSQKDLKSRRNSYNETRSPYRSAADVASSSDDPSERSPNVHKNIRALGYVSSDDCRNETGYNSNRGNYVSDFSAESPSNSSTVSSTSYATPPSTHPFGDKRLDDIDSTLNTPKVPASENCLSTANESRNNMKEDSDEGYVQHKRHTDKQLKRAMNQAEVTKQRNERFARRCMAFLRTGQCMHGDNCPFLHDRNFENVTQMPTTTVYEIPEMELTIGETMLVMTFHVDETFNFHVVPAYGQMTLWEVLACARKAQSDLVKIQELLHKTYDPMRGTRHPAQRAKLTQGMMVSLWLENRGILSGWHRGKLIRTDIYGGLMDIFLVDHGREVRTTSLNVFPLEDSLLEYPRQAIRCSLANVQPRERVSPGQIMSRLDSQLLILQVNKVNAAKDVEVDLFAECGTVSIAEQLINEGLFRREPTSMNERLICFGKTSMMYTVVASRG